MKTKVTRAMVVGALMGVMVAGQSMATTVWNPAANGIYPPAQGYFGDAANWTAGVPGAPDTKAVFNVPGAADCVVTGAYSGFQIVQGDNNVGGVLILTNGGTLSTTPGQWSAVGYNKDAHAIIEAGSTYNFGGHAWIGLSGDGVGVLEVNGGTVNVSEMFGLGFEGGEGHAHINSGTLNLSQWNDTKSISGASQLDVGAGTVYITGDHYNSVSNWISSGKIVGYGGSGEAQVVLDNADTNNILTIITATPGPEAPTEVVWNPAANTNNTDGLWADDDNWTGGVGPGIPTVVRFNISGAIPCRVTGPAYAAQITSGDTGPGGTLIVTNGASLNVGDTNSSVIGENNTGALVIEDGGSASFGSDLFIGLNSGSSGVFTMNGGTVDVDGMFGLGWSGGTGTANIHGGMLTLAQWDYYYSIQGASVLDVAGSGKVLILDDAEYSVLDYIAAGKITANGITNPIVGVDIFVAYDFGANETLLSAEYIAPAQTVWDPALNPSSTGLWSESANWSDGLPGSGTKTVFNVPNATNCVVDGVAITDRIVIGDGGPGGTVIVTNGGSLVVENESTWSAISYNDTSGTATLIVEDGGSVSFGNHLWIGFQSGAIGTMIINGGTVSVGQQFGLGWANSGGTGTVLVKGGTLNLFQIHPTSSITGSSVLDVSGTGVVIIQGDRMSDLDYYVANGFITSGGSSNVIYDYDEDANETVISAVPLPQDITDITVADGNVTLTYETFAGVTYHVESTPSLTPPIVWTSVAGTTTNAAGSSVTQTFPASGSADTFYRSVSP